MTKKKTLGKDAAPLAVPTRDLEPVMVHHPWTKFKRYPNAAMARAQLMSKYHDKIFTGPEAFKLAHSMDDLKMLAQDLLKAPVDLKSKREYINLLWPLIELRSQDMSHMFGHPDISHAVRNDSEATVTKSKEEDLTDGITYVAPHINVAPPSAERLDRIGKLMERGYLAVYRPDDLPAAKGWQRLPPQAKAVATFISTVCWNEETQQMEVVKEARLQKEVLGYRQLFRTKQDLWRIVAYYRSSLVSKGFLKLS